MGTKPVAIVVGFIGKCPVAGMTLYNLHYMAGLQQLGYEIHYVERINEGEKWYDPVADVETEDWSFAVSYLAATLREFGITETRFSFIDGLGVCHGSGWDGLNAALGQADFLMALADATWFPELERVGRRAFVDGDPMLTQADMLHRESSIAQALAHYPTLFTYATRMGESDCTVPAVGRQWLPARPVVATALWDRLAPNPSGPVTSLMNWAAGGPVTVDGRTYGHKDREFEAYIDLPKRSNDRFVLAVGGPTAPRVRLRELGWEMVNPLDATGTLEAYRNFIASSALDFGVAKHAYRASRSGWFSDRATCYLAAGRPVLHQDTGCGDWLPTGAGVLLFCDMESALDGLHRIRSDYEKHARAARAVAEEHFEAAVVLRQMLEAADFR